MYVHIYTYIYVCVLHVEPNAKSHDTRKGQKRCLYPCHGHKCLPQILAGDSKQEGGGKIKTQQIDFNIKKDSNIWN